jgi:hypothetical protein
VSLISGIRALFEINFFNAKTSCFKSDFLVLGLAIVCTKGVKSLLRVGEILLEV